MKTTKGICRSFAVTGLSMIAVISICGCSDNGEDKSSNILQEPEEKLTTKPSLTQQLAIAEINKLGGRINVDEKSSDKSVVLVDLNGPKVTDATLMHLKELTKLRMLGLSRTKITDAGLVHLKGLTKLEALGLRYNNVTDAGLVHLKGLTQLRLLALLGAQVTDAGLAHLNGLAQLQTLQLGGTQVTDAGVDKLKQSLPKCHITR